MNKKQKNRKDVAQNKRNRIKNRRYKSTIKTLFKIFGKKVKEINENGQNDQHIQELSLIKAKLHSFIDKAVNKNVIHKNNAARKKRKLELLQKAKI